MKQIKKQSKKASSKTIIKTVTKPAIKPAKAKTNPAKATPKAAIKNSPQTPPVMNNDSIATRAYLLWEKAGRPQGRDMEFWVQAETQLKQETQALAA